MKAVKACYLSPSNGKTVSASCPTSLPPCFSKGWEIKGYQKNASEHQVTWENWMSKEFLRDIKALGALFGPQSSTYIHHLSDCLLHCLSQKNRVTGRANEKTGSTVGFPCPPSWVSLHSATLGLFLWLQHIFFVLVTKIFFECTLPFIQNLDWYMLSGLCGLKMTY